MAYIKCVLHALKHVFTLAGSEWFVVIFTLYSMYGNSNKSQITNIFQNSKFYKKIKKMAALTKNAISVTVRYRMKWTKIWDHNGYNM